jgi:hypothetical protein
MAAAALAPDILECWGTGVVVSSPHQMYGEKTRKTSSVLICRRNVFLTRETAIAVKLLLIDGPTFRRIRARLHFSGGQRLEVRRRRRFLAPRPTSTSRRPRERQHDNLICSWHDDDVYRCSTRHAPAPVPGHFWRSFPLGGFRRITLSMQNRYELRPFSLSHPLSPS